MNNGMVRNFKNKKRIMAVGDIHGRYDLLLKLMQKIDFNANEDVLIFLGDYIDRGKHDFETVLFLDRLRKENKKSVFLLKGNHEEMAELALSNPRTIITKYGFGDVERDSEHMINWKYNGANKFSETEEKILLSFIQTLPLYLMTNSHVFVHAGVRDNEDINKQDSNILLWDRYNHNGYKNRVVIAGHTPTKDSHIYKINGVKVIIDTGAIRTDILTAYDVLNDIVYDTGDCI